MHTTGFAYVPTGCKNRDDCDVHVAFHGCLQTVGNIQMKFVDYTGYQDVAEANDIIVMFPQAASSIMSPSNYNGCWDWWGYVEGSGTFLKGTKYATKEGYQMSQVFSHLTALRQGTLALTPAVHEDLELLSF